MTDGVIHRKSVDGNVSLVHFTSYAFDLSAFGSNTGGVVRLPKDQTTQYLLNPDPNDDAYKKAPGTYRSEINKRFSEWLFPITFALIALAVAVTRQCDGCITTHTDAAIKQGATREEIVEALGVAVAVNAGAALVYSARVMDAFTAMTAAENIK